MQNQYKSTRSEIAHEDGTFRIIYGIKLNGEQDTCLADDIFDCESDAEEFAKLCTELDLAPEHFFEVIDDYLATK